MKSKTDFISTIGKTLNVETESKIFDLTNEISELKQTANGINDKISAIFEILTAKQNEK